MAPPTLSLSMDYWCISLARVCGASCRSASFTPPIAMNFSSPPAASAYLNGRRLTLREPGDAVVIGGRSGGPRPARLRPGHRYAARRRSGVSPFWRRRLMLAHVAAGQLHAYYEAHMNSWDALAGMLLIEEAGGTCNAFPRQCGPAARQPRAGRLRKRPASTGRPCWRNDATPPVSDRRRGLTPRVHCENIIRATLNRAKGLVKTGVRPLATGMVRAR